MPKFGKKKKADDGVSSLTSDFDFPESEEESSSDAEEGIPGLEIIDEDGQYPLEPPERYMACTSGLKLSIRSELDSEVVGQLEKGDVVLVTHTKIQADRLRLRCERGSPMPGKGVACGWVSAVEGEGETEDDNDGSLNLISEKCENQCYTVEAEHATAREGCLPDAKRLKFTLTEACTFECLEEVVDKGRTALRFKVGDREGWTQEKAPDGVVWCKKAPFVDVQGDKILKKVAQEKQKQEQAEAKAAAATAAAEAKAKAAEQKQEEKLKASEAKAQAEEAKAARKQVEKTRQDVRSFEVQLAALVESAPGVGGEVHPLDLNAIDLLQQAVSKIQQQTAEWEGDEDVDGDGDKYIVLAKSTVRVGPDGSSKKVGEHKQGSLINVCEALDANAEGLAVVRTDTPPAGWLKLKTSKGKRLLEKK